MILKKESKDGFNGKVGLSAGAGALWIKQNNLKYGAAAICNGGGGASSSEEIQVFLSNDF